MHETSSRNFTLIVPTHNRHPYLKRSIAFFKNLEADIIYCDSSTYKYTGLMSENMNYLHLPYKKFAEKILIGLDYVKTNYVALCADDVNIKLEHMFGHGDDPSKFTTFIFESLKNNVPQIELTPGEQKRDFIYIDDVIFAYDMLLNRMDGQTGFQEFDLGNGYAVTIRDFVETAKRLINSKTELLFGAKPYHEHEIMHSEADIKMLQDLGWTPRYSLEQGILKTIC